MRSTLLPAFIFLSALSTQPLLGVSDQATPKGPEPVLDTSGGRVLAGCTYSILPVPTTRCGGKGRCRGGSGLALASIDNKTCPLDVVVVEGYQYHGLPVTFTPFAPKMGVVFLFTDQNIQFFAETSCPYSTVWKLDDFDRSTGQWFVTTGGVLGTRSKKGVKSWFKIKKYGSAYKLVYCPTVCRSCRVQCKDIGVYADEEGNQRLTLSDVPLKVQFQQA